jgi:hypothetical protein
MLLSLEVRVFGTVGTKQKLGKDQSMSTPSCLDTSMPKHWQRENGSASVLFTKFGWIHGAKWEFTLSMGTEIVSYKKPDTSYTSITVQQGCKFGIHERRGKTINSSEETHKESLS